MIYTESDKDSLARFMCGFSPMNEFARSIRNEGEAASQTSTENDPFAGIDIDNLPDDLKAVITGAKTKFATLQTELTTEQTEKKKVEELSKKHQSRADQFHKKLIQHNLINVDGTTPANGQAVDPMLQKIADQLRTEHNLAPDAALAHAKIQLSSLKTFKQEIINEIGTGLNPTFAAVGDMYAAKLLAEAQLPKNDPQGYFQVPQILDGTKANLDMLVKGGATIDASTIQNIRSMEFGKYFSNLTPEKQQEFMNPQQQRQQQSTVQFGLNQGSSGHFAMLQNQNQSGAPAAANVETANAAAATMALLSRGLPKKGAK